MRLTIYQVQNSHITDKKVGWVESNKKMEVPNDLKEELQKAFALGKLKYLMPFYGKDILGTKMVTVLPSEDFKTFIAIAIGPLRWKYGIQNEKN